MSDGRDLRDEGMKRAEHSEEAPWRAMADQALLRLARSGRTFSAEDLTGIVGMPDQPNAVGARFSAFRRAALIEEAGYEQAERKSRHASRMLVWRGTPKAATAEPPVSLTKGARHVTPIRAGSPPKPVPEWRCPTEGCRKELVGVVVYAGDARFGTGKCLDCRKTFTVRRGS